MSTPEPIPVALTKREMTMGADCGSMRNILSLFDEREPGYGFEDQDGSWNINIEGACGEVAVGKLTNRFWSPTVNTFSAPDIGHNIQVKTRSRHDYELMIRPKDNPAHLYVLVTGLAPNFMVRGYFPGELARRNDWWHDYGGRPYAWFVPQAELYDIRDLIYDRATTATSAQRELSGLHPLAAMLSVR